MQPAEALAVIARVRRATRNADIMDVCDIAEAVAVRKPAAETFQPNVRETFQCPVCAARRAADNARLQRHRASKRELTHVR